MSFRDNLQHLRATRNMTQEQLAMLVGVSRQSVTKWEAEKAYPEMDKLLKLCQIFDCTLDELVQGDLTAREAEPELAVPTAALAADVVGYDEHWRDYAWHMAVGVACCILGIAASSGLDSYLSGAATTALVFVGAGLGLLFIIPAAMGHSAFKDAHPYVADFYTGEQRLEGKKAFGKRLAAGVCIIIAGLALENYASQWGDSGLADGAFLALVALGVGLIVHGSILRNRLDVEDYNISALEELDEDEVAAIVGEDRAPQVLAKVRTNKAKGALCGAILLVATAIALPLMFWATWNGVPFWMAYFWLPWPIGGLLCGVACIGIDQRS